MFKFLFFIFFLFLLLLFLMGFSIIRTFKNAFFSGNKKHGNYRQQSRSTNGNARASSSRRGDTTHDYTTAEEYDNEPQRRRRRKIFTKDEGEYVDYEEVK